MSYCDKCETDYAAREDEECMCPAYRRRMEDGRTDDVPMFWKLDNWDGYPNAPEYCDHHDYDESMDGSMKCKLCGLKSRGLT
jgi:hypothetical protein